MSSDYEMLQKSTFFPKEYSEVEPIQLHINAILSVQRVGVELTVSRVRTVRPCGYDANKVLSYFGCGVIEIGDHLGFN